ncbi:MAG: hypothetical protein GY821_10985 [Gammaproteobacteria bacterium]|nr:hypothetical protein [Gammaproteobacteria bacterium]
MQSEREQTKDSSSTQMAKQLAQDFLKSAQLVVKGISDQLPDDLSNMTKAMQNLITVGQKTLSGNPINLTLVAVKPNQLLRLNHRHKGSKIKWKTRLISVIMPPVTSVYRRGII